MLLLEEYVEPVAERPILLTERALADLDNDLRALRDRLYSEDDEAYIYLC